MTLFSSMESHSKYQLQVKKSGNYVLSNPSSLEILFFLKLQQMSETLKMSYERVPKGVTKRGRGSYRTLLLLCILARLQLVP